MDLLAHIADHLALSGTALAAALAVGIPFGALVTRVRALHGLSLGVLFIARTIPSLAVLALALPLVGIGFKPSVIALALLAIPPIALNTDLGLRSVAPAVRESARGLGMSESQIRRRVDWPLALPLVFTGVRIAAVEVVASATLAAFIGGGGLGEYIINGISENDTGQLLEGAISVGALTLAIQALLGIFERKLTTI
jgi:osmoprotectant transport system permease protein